MLNQDTMPRESQSVDRFQQDNAALKLALYEQLQNLNKGGPKGPVGPGPEPPLPGGGAVGPPVPPQPPVCQPHPHLL